MLNSLALSTPVQILTPITYGGTEESAHYDLTNDPITGKGDFEGIAIFTLIISLPEGPGSRLRVRYDEAPATAGPWTKCLKFNPDGPNGPGYTDTFGDEFYETYQYAMDLSSRPRFLRAVVEEVGDGTGVTFCIVMHAMKKVTG
jgi:hypothetical protein